MNNDDIEDRFVSYAAGILANTDLGLTGMMIAQLCVAYSIKAKVPIPHGTYPFAPEVPNKRTALIQNILAFPPKWKYKIIKELCKIYYTKKNLVNIIYKYGYILYRIIE